jgi:ABC-2 type transport system permease protein
MLGSVLTQTVRAARRGLLWWSAGIAALVLFTVSLYPSIEGNDDLARAAEDYPEALQAFFGGDFDIASPAGYLNAELFSFMVPLLLLVYAISAGARAIAGEEESGTLDLLLAYPVSRARLALEKAGALALQLAVLALALFVTVAASAQLVSMDIAASSVTAAVVGTYLLALAYGVLALLVGAATGRRALAVGASAALAAAAYLLNGLAQVVDVLEPWRVLSPFEWLGVPIRDGLSPGGGAALLLAAATATAIAVPLFDRRDIAV